MAALIAAAASLSLARGGTEARLLRRAKEALELADRVRPQKTRSALHRAAERDIERALTLRQTGRAVWYLAVSLFGSIAACVLIPWYVDVTPAGASDWVGGFWLMLWVIYIVLALALLVVLSQLLVVQGRAMDD